MKLSFTTLGCPKWSWTRIVEQAGLLEFDGIEVRGIQNELDIEKLEPFQAGNIDATIEQLSAHGLSIPCLDTSCTFLSDTAFADTLQAGRAAIDVAARLGSPFIRVFGDRIPQGMDEQTAVARVAEGMQQLGEYAEGKGVLVLQETHGNFAESRLLLEVFARVSSPAAGILWDIANPYEFGETVFQTWSQIKHSVRHAHIKDAESRNGTIIPCLPGHGNVPIGDAIKILKEAGYDGWLSFEWEKRWHETIEEPEVALPAFMEHIKKYL